MDVLKDPIGTIKEAFAGTPTKYNNVSRRTLEKYGNDKILTLKIARTPLNKMLSGILNVMTLNKWNELQKKYGFDNLFHLSLIANDVIIEKNETVTIEEVKHSSSLKSNTEYHNVPLNGKNITIKELVDNGQKMMGDKWFSYESFSNNCQSFVSSILRANGLETPEIRKFLYQDLTDFNEDLNKSGFSFVPKVMKHITDLGSIASRLTGKGTKKQALKAFEEHLKKNNFDNDNDNFTERFIEFINCEGLKFL